MKHQRGFTLLEVLVALAIIAISFTAILRAEIVNIHDAEYIQDKTAASWVAQNVINGIQLHVLSASVPGEFDDKTVMLGKTWYWHASLDSTESDAVDSITVTVSPTLNGNPIVTVQGFLAGASS